MFITGNGFSFITFLKVSLKYALFQGIKFYKFMDKIKENKNRLKKIIFLNFQISQYGTVKLIRPPNTANLIVAVSLFTGVSTCVHRQKFTRTKKTV